ncbi:MAG: glutathione peroxidase [Marinobacterium sp.]|nr:glutathione peroxidase [Marinobacterium sp.]
MISSRALFDTLLAGLLLLAMLLPLPARANAMVDAVAVADVIAVTDATAATDDYKARRCPAVLDHRFRRLGEQRTEHLCHDYAGKLLLIVNTASKCAFTSQYEGLEALYDRYRQRGLVVLGFPSNDFAGQEPGTEQQVSNFCRLTYSVEFPMFEKVHAAKRNAAPFYHQLAALADGHYPGWNFHKYLLAPDGKLLGSYSSWVKPDHQALVSMIENNLPFSAETAANRESERHE